MLNRKAGSGLGLLGLFVAAAATNQIVPASAQTSSTPSATGNEIETVVVTAERRAQNVLEVPLAVQAISPSQIENMGATSVADLVKVIPGAAYVAGFGGGFETIEIRGVAAGQWGDGLVGYYVDDMAFGIPNIQLVPPSNLLDLDRVEAILGPSGTLYGQGSMGGTIKLVTKQPDSESFSGEAFAEASLTDGGGGNYDVGGVLNIPVVEDKLAVRIAGEFDDLSGYANVVSGVSTVSAQNLNLSRANPERSSNLRVSALWTPTSTVSVSAFYWYIRDDQDFSSFLATTNPPTISGAGGVNGLTDIDMNVFSGTLKWKTPIGDFMNNASYFDHDIDLVIPLGTSYNPITNPIYGPLYIHDTFKTHQFTDEARLTSNEEDRVKWLVGVFYRDATINTDALEVYPDLFNLGIALPLINFTGPLTTDSYSIYGQVSVPLFDGKLEPLVGLRYYDDHRTFAATEYLSYPRNPALTTLESASTTWTSLNPRFNLKYTPTDNGIVYINIAKGFRSGSLQSGDQAAAANAALFGSPIGPVKTVVNPDSLWTYELGTKWELVNQTLIAQAGVYRTDWKNVNFDFTLPPYYILAVANVGNARIYGADFGFEWQTPVQGLSLAASGNIEDAYTRRRTSL